MPRGRKKMEKITLEEQLALVDKEIEATESSNLGSSLTELSTSEFEDKYRMETIPFGSFF